MGRYLCDIHISTCSMNELAVVSIQAQDQSSETGKRVKLIKVTRVLHGGVFRFSLNLL